MKVNKGFENKRKPKNDGGDESTEAKKPFDKKTYRLKKYSNKYKGGSQIDSLLLFFVSYAKNQVLSHSFEVYAENK